MKPTKIMLVLDTRDKYCGYCHLQRKEGFCDLFREPLDNRRGIGLALRLEPCLQAEIKEEYAPT